MTKNYWVQYKIDDSAVVPDDLRLSIRLRFGGISKLLSEKWGSKIPKRGDRFRVYKRDLETQDLLGTDGDWVVTEVTEYEGPPGAEYDAIVICDCVYAPLPDRSWVSIPKGTPYALA